MLDHGAAMMTLIECIDLHAATTHYQQPRKFCMRLQKYSQSRLFK